MPYLWTAYSKFSSPGYNNAMPRDFQATLEGKSRRAYFAHLNAFEVLPLFIAAVVISNLNQVSLNTIHGLISVNLILRTLYGFFYIYNLSTLRSLVWTGALTCNLALLILSLRS